MQCRLSTVRSADHTVVMEAGRIVEEGTHDSLLAEGKIYAMLVRRQSGQAVDTARPRDDDKPSPELQVSIACIPCYVDCSLHMYPCRHDARHCAFQ